MKSPVRSVRSCVHKGSIKSTIKRGVNTKAITLFLIVNLLIWPTSGSAKQLGDLASAVVVSSTITITSGPMRAASYLVKLLFGGRRHPERQRETTAQRTAAVSSIRINPGRIVGYTGQRIKFSAVGSNVNGMTIQGAQFSWNSSDQEKLAIDTSGSAILTTPGVVWVSASTPTASARVPVLVREGARPVQTDEEWIFDQGRLNPDGTVGPQGGMGSALKNMLDIIAPTAHAQASGGDGGDFGYDELWSEPRNLVGSPRNTIGTSSAIGSVLPEGSNFEFSVPLYSLSGRGVSTGIALKYNSRIWSQHSSAVTFNAVNTWPALGFTLSFGRIVTYGTSGSTKFVLIDSDGTRHYLGTGAIGTTNTYQTNDGSHITYIGNGTSGGTIYYNNGMTKSVAITNNRLLVQAITDTNGNQFTIYYRSLSNSNNACIDSQGHQAIDYIYDTMGRFIQFNYNSNNNLISIDVPGYGGTAMSPVTTTVVRFDYTSSSPSTSFSGLTVENVPTGGCQATLLSHVYYPATNTGHKFTYSAYGMISTVSLRKDMTYNSGTGAIGDGNEKAYVSYNYPASASSLTAAPTFTQWTQSPAATTGGTATWSFSSSSGSGTLSYTVTNPDSTTQILTRSTTGTYTGLLSQTEVKTSGGTSMAKSVITYLTDGGSQPQVDNVVSYDDASNQTKVDFSYDSYGNVTNTREYGFQQSGSWVVRRRTRNVYKTDTSYVNAYLRSLVIENDVYDAQLDTNDANDVLLAKTTNTYDNYSAMSGMEDYGGTTYSIGRLPGYDASYTLRGNVTGVTQYTDVSAPTSITHLRKLDIFGNTVKEEVSCCSLLSTTTDDPNGFGIVTAETKGDPAGTTLTMQYVSDFNTSVRDDVEDPNSLHATVSSRDSALRPTQIDLPVTGTHTSETYNDSTLSFSRSKVYDDGGTTKTVTKTTEYDGWGRVIHEKNIHGGQVDTRYDNMGRVSSKSNPFAVGGSPSYWTSYAYDALGRGTTITLPDSQTITTTYSGPTVTTTDEVNRQTKRDSDGLGRVVTAYEQDPFTAGLTQGTNYSYDYLNNITQVDQAGQLRKFKFDATSRLLYEKIPEQTASINDGTGTLWTTKFTYTDFDSVATKTDARGVVTTNSYDSLNRLTQVSYNTISGVTTAPSVFYTYDYDSTYGTTNNGHLVKTVLGTSTYEEYYAVGTYTRPASTIRKVYGGTTRTYTTSYSLNDGSQMTQLTYPSGLSVATTHDSAGRTTGLQNTSTMTNYLSSISYNVAGQVTGDAMGNGVTEQFGYDAARMQLTSQKAGTTSPYTNRMNLNYGYSASSGQMGVGSTAGNAGPLMSIASSTINGTAESAAYTYDNYGRLVTSDQTSNGSSAQRRYEYDRWGNRTGAWDATSGGNHIQAIGLEQSSGVPTNRIQTSTKTNFALSSNGSSASASSSFSASYPASAVIDGDRRGTNWGSGGGWMDNTSATYPDWVQVTFSGSKTIDEIDVFTLQDNYASPSDPTEGMTFSNNGIVDFQVQYWNGLGWATVSGGSITSNNKVWKKVSFSQITTTKIRVNVTSALNNYSRVTELEAWGPAAGTSYTYDAAGNVTNDGVHTYTYDSANRIVSVDSGSTATYLYDHQNQRYKKTVGSTVTHYVWLGGMVIAEHNGSTGAVLNDYAYSGKRMIAKISGSTQYFLSDRLSTRAVLDSSGNVSGRQAHLPFGEDFGETGSQEKHHFTTYERDTESGLDYAMNRNYAVGIGRFFMTDPYRPSSCTAGPQSWNRYSYAANDPINHIDPTGLIAYIGPPIIKLPPPPTTGFPPEDFNGIGNENLLIENPPDPPAPPEEPGDLLDLLIAALAKALGSVTPCEQALAKALVEVTAVEVPAFSDAISIGLELIADRKVANKYEDRHGGSGKKNDDNTVNAHKHCIWSCELSRSFGEDTARDWTDAHECGSTSESSNMDLHNNFIGRWLGSQTTSVGQSCEALCEAMPVQAKPGTPNDSSLYVIKP